MVQQESFYKRIIDWKYLIINGYFDFQNKNTFTDKVSNFYGKDDVIDPESFNLNRLSDKNIYSYISNEEYVKYKDPFSDGKVITTRNNKNQDKRWIDSTLYRHPPSILCINSIIVLMDHTTIDNRVCPSFVSDSAIIIPVQPAIVNIPPAMLVFAYACVIPV